MRRLTPLFAFLLVVVLVSALNSPKPIASAPLSQLSSQPTNYVPGSNTTVIATGTWTIPTYPYAPALFWMTNTTYNIAYPVLHWGNYYARNHYNPTPTPKDYTLLVLENEWLKVWLMPELGGRVYQIFYKPLDKAQLYQNGVIKPTNWGPQEQGWWLAAGGIEWGLPVEEHGYEWGIPWSYTIVTGTDGISVTMRDSTQPDRLRAAVSIFLPNDRAALMIRPRIENDRDMELDFKWWINAMLAPGGVNSVGTKDYDYTTSDIHFVYPASEVTIHSTGDSSLPGENAPTGPYLSMPWPIFNGRDLSFLRNWNQYLGFFARPAASSEFAGVYNIKQQQGVVRIFPHQITTGLKAFGMGWNDPLPYTLWSDMPQYYVEMHGGLAPTFWDSARLGAHESIEWEETWYPVAGLPDLTTATAEAALHVEPAGDYLHIGLFSTRLHDWGRLMIYQRSTCAFLRKYEFGPFGPSQSIFFTPTITATLDDVTMFASGDGKTALAGYNLPIGGPAPTVAIDPLSPVNPVSFAVVWLGDGCIRSFDVQVRDGFDGAWTPWLTDTMQNSAIFSGTHGHTYFFRARARGLNGSMSAYQNDPWGETYTTVLITPSAVMETSSKTAPWVVEKGDSIEHTITLSNTGNLTGSIRLTDTLPPSMTLIIDTLAAGSDPAPIFDRSRITWSGTVTPGESVRITYALTPTLDLGLMQPQTNTVMIEGGIVPVTRTAVTSLARIVYLPVIMR